MQESLKIYTPVIKPSYKTKRMKSIRLVQEKVNQWNGIQVLEPDPHIHGHLIYDKDATEVHGKRTVFSINDTRSIMYFYSYTTRLFNLLH